VRLWRRGTGKNRLRRLVDATLTFGVGGGLVLGATAAYLAAKGAWPDVHYTFFEYVPHYTRIFFSWENLPTLLLQALRSWPTTPHVFVWAGVLLALFLPRRHPREREALFLVIGAAFLQVVGIALQAKFFPYHYGGVLPLAALTAVWGYAKLSFMPGASLWLTVVAALGLHYLGVQHALLLRSGERLQALVDAPRRNQINDRLYTIHDVNAGADRLAAEWIAANTPEHLPIYVWGFEPVIYELAQRRSASRYIYNVPQRSAWGQEAARETLMRELMSSPPSAIVTAKEDRLYHVVGNSLDSHEALLTFPELYRFIQEAYVEVAAVEDLTIFSRADLTAAAEHAASKRERLNRAATIPPTKRHVLLLTVDTLRPDYLSSRGYDLPTTPAIDGLSRNAVVFDHAVTPIPRTTPALASMLTGRYPHGTGVRTLVDRLPPAATSLAELARDNGYKTVAVVSNHILTPARGLYQGFDEYDFSGDTRSAMQTTEVVKTALGTTRPEDAIFLWVHYIDPHVPYFPLHKTAEALTAEYDGPYRYNFGDVHGGTGNDAYPKDLPKKQAVFQNSLPDYVNEHIRRLYAADVRDTDDAIAELLLWLRSTLGNDWTIVFTADHGESLGEHDFYYDHGDYVYEASTRIPLVIALPTGQSSDGAAEVSDWVSLIDIAPTLIDILDWEVSSEDASHFDGRSLVPYLNGAPLPSRPVFAECGHSYFPEMIKGRVRFDVAGRFRAVWSDHWKLIWTPFQEPGLEYQLYDLSADPHERDNVSAEYHERTAALAQELRAWVTLGGDPAQRQPLSEDDYKRLRSLGYVE